MTGDGYWMIVGPLIITLGLAVWMGLLLYGARYEPRPPARARPVETATGDAPGSASGGPGPWIERIDSDRSQPASDRERASLGR